MNFDADVILTAAGVARRFEGLYLTPYLCPAGVPTIGYGTTRYPDGVRVSLTDSPITRERAEELLQFDLRSSLRAALKLCPILRAWGCNPTAAIDDFCYNLGSSRLSASTLRKKINANDPDGAKRELVKWVYGGGRKLRGLTLRRAAECALIG